jgi:HSP20 family protein
MLAPTPFQRNPWSILDELESLQEDMNRVFGGWAPTRTARNTHRVYPPVNIWSSRDGVTVDAEMPGVDIKDVDISVEADQLTIRGKVNVEDPREGETYHRNERPAGEFVRTLQLPFRANAEGVKATYKNGILRVAVPRTEEDKPRKVKIEAA